MAFFKAKFYNSLKPSNFFIPEELVNYRVNCNQCSRVFSPDWLNKRHPLTPVKPLNDDTGRWIPFKTTVQCPHCNSHVDFDLPSKKADSTYCWYGDEAYRIVDGKQVITYTLIGNNRNFIENNIEGFRALKKSILPDVSPLSWKLHMAKMWNSSDRVGHDLFSSLTQVEVIKFSERLAKYLNGLDDGFLIYNVVGIYNIPDTKEQKKHFFNEIRNRCYSCLIMKVISDSANAGVKPLMYFDSDSKDGWAKDVFYGLQVSLLYAYLAKGIEIPEPIYQPPALHEFNEIADFVSFLIARYCHQKILKRNIEVDPKLLGKMTYIGFRSNTEMLYLYDKGFPWKLFYGSN